MLQTKLYYYIQIVKSIYIRTNVTKSCQNNKLNSQEITGIVVHKGKKNLFPFNGLCRIDPTFRVGSAGRLRGAPMLVILESICFIASERATLKRASVAASQFMQ